MSHGKTGDDVQSGLVCGAVMQLPPKAAGPGLLEGKAALKASLEHINYTKASIFLLLER